ncbi:MAG: hypothetical protein Aurels2KO_32140 [Aureliella sp.]
MIYARMNKSYCVLVLFCLQFLGAQVAVGPQAFGGLVLTKQGYTDVQAATIQKARKLVEKNELDKARELLADLRAERKDLLAADVMLFELIANGPNGGLARQVLEQFSVKTKPSFDVFYAFAKLAMAEKRYFDAFMHAQLALNHPMADDWTDGYKSRMRVEAQVVALESCEGRGAWGLCRQILAPIELTEESDSRLINFAGKAAFFLGDVEEATKYFDMANDSPDAAPTDLILARLYESQNKTDQSNAHYRAAVRGSSGEERASIALEYGRWLLDHDRASDTIAILKRVETEARADDVTLLAATAKRLTGNYAEAITDLEQLQHRREDSFAVRNQLALALTHLNETKSNRYALELAQSNAEKHPNILEAWSTLGWLQVLNGDLDASKQSLARAAASGNISRDTAYFIHRMHLADGNEQAAKKFLDAARSGKGPFFFRTEIK